MISSEKELSIYPCKHFVLPRERIAGAIQDIKDELGERLDQLKGNGKLLEAQRLAARTRFDIEMLQEVGYCPGIENYSRPLSGRDPGSMPDTLFNFSLTITYCLSTNRTRPFRKCAPCMLVTTVAKLP